MSTEVLGDLPPRVVVESWSPAAEIDTESMVADTIYVLPTRTITVSENAVVVFDDSARFLPKYARAAGVETQFAPMKSDRRFLSEYSHDPGAWELALAFIGFFNDWVILAVNTWITARCGVTGMSQAEAMEHEMELELAEWKPEKGKFTGLRIKGKGADVVAAIRELRSLGD